MPKRMEALSEFLSFLEGLTEAAESAVTPRAIARVYAAIIKLHDEWLREVDCPEDTAWTEYFNTATRMNLIISHLNEAGLRSFSRTDVDADHPVVERILGPAREKTSLFVDSGWDPAVCGDVLAAFFKLSRATYFKSWMPLLGSRAAICARGLLRESIQDPALVCTNTSAVHLARGKLLERSTLPHTAEFLGLHRSEWILADVSQARRQALVAAGFHAAKGWEVCSPKEVKEGVTELNRLLAFFDSSRAPDLRSGSYYEALDGSWTFGSVLGLLDRAASVKRSKNTEGDLILQIQTHAGEKLLLRTVPTPSFYSPEWDTPQEVERFNQDPLGYIVRNRARGSVVLKHFAACRERLDVYRMQFAATGGAVPLFALSGIAAGKLVGAYLLPDLDDAVIEAMVGAIGVWVGRKVLEQPERVFDGWQWEEEVLSTGG